LLLGIEIWVTRPVGRLPLQFGPNLDQFSAFSLFPPFFGIQN
jgi:hypothetical protein